MHPAAWLTCGMTRYVIELPDLVAVALEQAAQAFGVDPEALIAESIRALPGFQDAMRCQALLIQSLVGSSNAPGDMHV